MKRDERARRDGERLTFSILKRIVMGETRVKEFFGVRQPPFSILKRIVMGETYPFAFHSITPFLFQYPQADRDG